MALLSGVSSDPFVPHENGGGAGVGAGTGVGGGGVVAADEQIDQPDWVTE
jgi:hypothetical protein